MSDFWRCNHVDVRLPLDVLDRLLARTSRRPFASAGLALAGGVARILLWSSPQSPEEPAIVGMVVVRAGAPEGDAPAIRELHWPRTSDEGILWRTLERLAGQPLEPAGVRVAS